MGTSKNYPSPKTPRWNAVRMGYTNNSLPLERVTAEVWRAATSENKALESMIASDLIFKCNKIVSSAASALEAHRTFTAEIIGSKTNSLVVEFAKRAIVQSFQRGSGDLAHSWRSNFVSELTDYFVSRDIAGFFGAGCRNKNISEINTFRRELKGIVSDKIRSMDMKVETFGDWKNFVGLSLERLKSK